MVLPTQVSYFDSASEGKPLLHIWSLSLEEQYYFILPVLLLLLPRKFRLFGLCALLLGSLEWCFSWVYSAEQEPPILWRLADATTKYEWAFYLLPTRAWELLAGSVCAWLMLKNPNFSVPVTLKRLALGAVLVLGSYSIHNDHPGVEAVLIVIFTCLMLVGHDNWLPQFRIIRAVELVGNWSYSIYLVHWPLFAFAFLLFVGEVPIAISFAIIPLSIVLGYLQYRHIEEPFRHGLADLNRQKSSLIAVATLVLMGLPMMRYFWPNTQDAQYEQMRLVNQGFGKACEDGFKSDIELDAQCKSSDKVDTVVWGDSYAMHLIPGLVQSNANKAQVTKSSCAPILGIAPVDEKHSSTWAQECIEFNRKALQYVLSEPQVQNVVLSTPIRNYLAFEDIQFETEKGLTTLNMTNYVAYWEQTMKSLNHAGKKVLFITPTPSTGFDVGECLERYFGSAALWRATCNILLDDVQQYQEKTIRVVAELAKIVPVLDLAKRMCNSKQCSVYEQGEFLYRDGGHLSIAGSRIVLGNLVVQDFVAQKRLD